MRDKFGERDIVIDAEGVLDGEDLARFLSMENGREVLLFIVGRNSDGAKESDIIRELGFRFEVDDPEFAKSLITVARKILASKPVRSIRSGSEWKTCGGSLLFVPVGLILGNIFDSTEWYIASGAALLLSIISAIKAISISYKKG